MFPDGDVQMGDKNQAPYKEDNPDSLDDIDSDDVDFDESSSKLKKTPKDTKSEEERRHRARREIERRNELKALRSELADWDDLDTSFDEEEIE